MGEEWDELLVCMGPSCGASGCSIWTLRAGGPSEPDGAAVLAQDLGALALALHLTESADPAHDQKLDAPSGTARGDRRAAAAGHPDPLGSATRPGRASGGDLRRAGADADDPSRHHLTRRVRPRRAARAREGRACRRGSRSVSTHSCKRPTPACSSGPAAAAGVADLAVPDRREPQGRLFRAGRRLSRLRPRR